jgi:heme ABC exporter ATP-binding subunit CcmA
VSVTTGAPLLRVRGLVKGYGGPPVLRGVDFDLAAGESLVLLGPNGAGKSTLLRLLAGLHKPQQGDVLLDGTPFHSDDPAQRRRIGFVSHDLLLYAGLSARENLRFTASLFGLRAPESRIDAVLAAVGLDWVGERPLRAYSRGMAQRLTTARALLHRPALLLLDEPMTGLDPAGIHGLEEILADFRAAGGAVLMTTHDLAHVAGTGTRAAFLRRGRVEDEVMGPQLGAAALEARWLALFPGRRAAPGGDAMTPREVDR